MILMNNIILKIHLLRKMLNYNVQMYLINFYSGFILFILVTRIFIKINLNKSSCYLYIFTEIKRLKYVKKQLKKYMEKWKMIFYFDPY